MRTSSGMFRAAVAVLTTASVVGCAQIDMLKAKKAFKEANAAYAAQDYKTAAEGYARVVEMDPSEVRAYFYLGNSYDNQYNENKPDDAANRALLDKAVKYYQESIDKLAGKPEYKDLRNSSYVYLAAAYGEGKLNDPTKAEPVLLKMIENDPSDPTNYHRLADLYEKAGVYDQAEKMYLKARDVKPNDPVVYTTLAAYYNRRGEFEKTIKALEDRASKEPDNPAAFHMIASYYWDETRNDPKLKDAQKREYIERGLKAVNRAIELKPDYPEAITFKGLLLRLEALVEKNPARQKELLAEAVKLSERATALIKKQTAAPATQSSSSD